MFALKMRSVETLEDRTVPAVVALYVSDTLMVSGDALNNNISISADGDGTLRVTENGQSVNIRVLTGQANRSNLANIVVEGRGGNDTITTQSSLNTLVNGTLANAPTATLLGGSGDDTLTVGHGGIVGGLAGVVNGVVVGRVVGNSYMSGGSGNDTLNSGFGNDIMVGDDGNDTYVWLPGTLTDVWDGGAGTDTAIVVGNDTFLGAAAADQFTLKANGTRVQFDRVNLVQFRVDIGTTENVVLRPGQGNDGVVISDLRGVASLRTVTVDGGDGDDVIDGSGQRSALVALVLSGGLGNDEIRGGSGANTLVGGAGDDKLVAGNGQAANVLIGGSGADTFQARRRDSVVDLSAAEGDVVIVI